MKNAPREAAHYFPARQRKEEIMKKRLLAMLLLAALTTGLCAYAVQEGALMPEPQAPFTAGDPEAPPAPEGDTPAPAPEGEAETPPADNAPQTPQRVPTSAAAGQAPAAQAQPAPASAEPSAAPAVKSGGSLTFYGIDRTVRANNLTLKSLENKLKEIQNTNTDMQFDGQEIVLAMSISSYQKQLYAQQEQRRAVEAISIDPESTDPSIGALKDSLLSMIDGNIASLEQSIASAQASIDNMDDARKDAREQIEDTYTTTKRTVENTADQMVMGAETLYINVAIQRLSLADRQRQLDAMDRQISEMETRYRLGQIAEIDLAQLKSGRETLSSGMQSQSFAIDNMQVQLGGLLGWDVGVKAEVSVLTPITESQLRGMNYENDVAEALKNSYTIFQKQDALNAANNKYEDDLKSSIYGVDAAKIDKQSAERSVRQSFLTLSNTTLEKNRLVAAAQSTYELQVRLYDITAKKLELGQISQNELLTAQDDLDSAKTAVVAAQYELFAAYNQYQWAKRGVIGS